MFRFLLIVPLLRLEVLLGMLLLLLRFSVKLLQLPRVTSLSFLYMFMWYFYMLELVLSFKELLCMLEFSMGLQRLFCLTTFDVLLTEMNFEEKDSGNSVWFFISSLYLVSKIFFDFSLGLELMIPPLLLELN